MEKFFGLMEVRKPTVLTIGVFDGIHRGHQRIIEETVRIAQKENLKSVVVTFEPDPEEVLKKAKRILLTPLGEKLSLIEKLGIDALFIIEFNRELSHLEPESFIGDLILKLKPRWLVVGEGFRFGKRRKGNINFLKAFGQTHGFKVQSIPLLKINGEFISSTLIRNYLKKGDIGKAENLLGRFPRIYGKVTRGLKKSREIGFPTANLEVNERLFLPGKGVYAGYVEIEGKNYSCAIYIGTSPSLQIHKLRVEVFIPELKADLYGKEIVVELRKKIRDEMIFRDTKSRERQIRLDVQHLL